MQNPLNSQTSFFDLPPWQWISWLLCALLVIPTLGHTEQTATSVLKKHEQAIYKIRIIERSSGNKAAGGSGFQITENGLMATNYHVVSDVVFYPNQFRAEYIDHDGKSGPLQVVDVDVIHDLALVKKVDEATSSFLQLAAEPPKKGDRLHAIGNPHGLGISVVPGTYNGLIEHSYLPNIHFTGSINPGMSGGPTLNGKGEVVGINVATMGEQIGFLVPVEKLQTLFNSYLARTGPTPLFARISEELTDYQANFFNDLLEEEWPTLGLGNASVPNPDLPYLECWGNSNHNEMDAKVKESARQCHMNSNIFLTGNLRTGTFLIWYQWLQGKDLTPLRFYNNYAQHFGNMNPDNRAAKQHVTSFSCSQDFFTNQKSATPFTARGVFCTRAYNRLPNLYDVLFVAAAIDKSNEGLIGHFTLSGVSKGTALRFTKFFMETLQWKSSSK